MENKILYLSRLDVEKAGPETDVLIKKLETAFREKGEGRTELLPKGGLHPVSEDNFIHAMPASIPALGATGIKWVSGYPGNPKRNLPYINGLLILNQPETGLPISVMDAVWLTGKRTGAATALSARFLARAESSVLGVLGCGVQGRCNLEALQTLFPLKEVRAFDVLPEVRKTYVEEAAAKYGLKAVPAGTPRESVEGCDLIVTAGPILKTPHETIRAEWLEPGVFISMVDYDSYFTRTALSRASKFCTDDTAQLRYAQTQGYFQNIPPIHADLGELVTGRRAGRESGREITMAANLGVALADMTIASMIYHRAREMGIGVELPF